MKVPAIKGVAVLSHLSGQVLLMVQDPGVALLQMAQVLWEMMTLVAEFLCLW